MKMYIYYCVLFLVSVSAQESPTVLQFDTAIFDLDKLSAPCKAQLESGDSDSLMAIADATAKIPSGILKMRFFYLGDFDECYGVHNSTSGIYGKYCLGTLPLTAVADLFQIDITAVQRSQKVVDRMQNVVPRTLGTDQSTMGFHFGICMPNKCTADDFHEIFDLLIFKEHFCYSKATDPEWSSGATATVTILACFVGLLILSTAFDLYLYYTGKKSPHPILLAFSAFSNGKKLFASTKNRDQLLCLNGLKAISMMWVLISHVYMHSMMGPLGNYGELQLWIDDVWNMFILGASVSVDTFFVVGGLVAVYTFLRSMDKGGKFNVLIYYVHRYIRLTPLLAIMILIHAELVQFMGNGPMWANIYDNLVVDCKDYWWSGLLYLQNYFHGIGTCVPQAWYLSVDFQLFLLSPIVLLPLTKWPKYTLYGIWILILAGILIPFGVTYYYEIPAMMTSPQQNSDVLMWNYYKQTYTRFGPYVIGMLAGYYIYQLKKSEDKVKLSPLTALSLWIICLGSLCACVFAPHEIVVGTEFNLWENSIANTGIRNGWAIALCILIYLCVAGYGGPIDWFLSIPIFQLITKLSYAIYLIHYWTIMIRYASTKEPITFTNTILMWSFWGDFALTIMLSIAFTLMFESPMIIIEKFLFGSGKPRKS